MFTVWKGDLRLRISNWVGATRYTGGLSIVYGSLLYIQPVICLVYKVDGYEK